MILVKKNFNYSEIDTVAAEIINSIASKQFVVWLNGELGAGKTTLTKSLLRALGLAKEVVVQSPTFTYVNEYLINGDYFAHCDFYRCQKGAEITDMLEHREFRGVFIEWSEMVSDAPKPDFIIELRSIGEFKRDLVLKTPLAV